MDSQIHGLTPENLGLECFVLCQQITSTVYQTSQGVLLHFIEEPIQPFLLHGTVHCTEKIVELGAVHMVDARLYCERAMFRTWWATSHPHCMDRLRKHYSHLVGGSFLARKAAWSLGGCKTS